MISPRLNIRFNPLLMMLLALFMLTVQGCFHSGGGGGGTVTNADPTGYYNVLGKASVDNGNSETLVIEDLQGMVSGDRFIAISDANGLVYDGKITDITGNDFSAAVSVFQNGIFLSTATLTGMITEGAKITGTLTGNEQGNGTINELLYALSNDTVAALSNVQNNGSERWFDRVGGGNAIGLGFIVEVTGNITHAFSATDGVFDQCAVEAGTISPSVGTSLYSLNMMLSNCNDPDVNGGYSGLASMRTESTESPVGDRLVLVVSKANFSLQGEFKISDGL